ncbi:MAG: phosphoribosylaminoimidazolesuccinocarboxamide synthase [Gemmatimonadaceae bacterium]
MLLSHTSLPLPLLRRGKVRDVYEVDAERLLIVATDRVSAFDIVMAEAIPEKGMVLTQITAWWLRQMAPLVRHHLLLDDAVAICSDLPELAPHLEELTGRAMLCVRADVFPVECVMRGYISGSAWKEYASTGTMAGQPLARGLVESSRLPAPIFTPATKAHTGHDENITVGRLRGIVGSETAVELERLTRLIYDFGQGLAGERGIIIADTKVEFGYLANASGAVEEFDPARVILVDEVLTPDSSRFWPADRYAPGGPQPSFDKQPLRDYLEAERAACRWNGENPPPPLPEEVITATSERYLDIYRRLTHARPDTGALI